MDRSTATRIRRPRTKSEPEGRAAAASRPSEQLRSDMLALLLFLLGVLLALGTYRPGSAGIVGSGLVHFVRFWMGQVGIAAPVLLIGAGLMLAIDCRRATNPQLLLGVGLLLAMLFGWVHLLATLPGHAFDTTGARIAAILHRRHDAELLQVADGGFLGALVMSLMHPLGRLGSFITLGAAGLAAVLLITELTLRGIFERVHERSRITAERARMAADRARTAAEAVASSLPVRAPRRTQSPFIELEDETEDEPLAPVRPSPRAEKEKKRPGRLTRVGGKVTDVTDDMLPALPGPVPDPFAGLPEVPEVSPEPLLPEIELDVEPATPARPTPAANRAKARPVRPAPPRGGDTAGYVMPPLELLEPAVARPVRAAADTQANIAILENTLGQFRIQAQVVEIADGPSVTRYEIRLGEGIRVKKILDLADNIAMSLAAMSVRVEAPIPGKAAIGIEVPKKHPAVVTLRECLDSNECRDLKSKVGFVLGKDVAGEVRCADLARMPHLLVAGATNSGKSVCLNVLIASMLYRARPDELKMIMIDPKRVELTLFDGIPHLIHPVVKDVKQAAGILRWVLKEMDRRYDLFAAVMTRNIENYNEKVGKDPEKRLPFLVVIIDELADLMMQQGPEVEQSICRLAQLARATGIHLVVATQRPSVDVITGLIKANVPSRISFAVTSQIDSRTILDGKGAENLVGRGDMLFKPVDAAKPVRIQGAFLKESEVEALVNHLKAQGRPEYCAESLAVDHGAYGKASEEETEDDMFEPAARFVVTTGHASTSMIQRKFKIGYTRAARLVDMMEARGIVGALDGAKPRDILMSRDQLDQMFLDIRESPFRGQGGPAEDEDDLVEMEETIGPGGDPFVED